MRACILCTDTPYRGLYRKRSCASMRAERMEAEPHAIYLSTLYTQCAVQPCTHSYTCLVICVLSSTARSGLDRPVVVCVCAYVRIVIAVFCFVFVSIGFGPANLIAGFIWFVDV